MIRISPSHAYGILIASFLTKTSSSLVTNVSPFIFEDRRTLIPSSQTSDGLYVNPRRVSAISLNLRCSQEIE